MTHNREKNFEAVSGVFPTMITPYKDNKIDFGATEALVRWYWEQGCDGIFAVCQSSEIFFLTLEERVSLLRCVIKKAKELASCDPSRAPMQIVASGHISDSFEDQVKELSAIAAEGPDAIILISNRMDTDNTSDEKWIEDTERLIKMLPADIPLGMYECPKPYKRLLSERMIRYMIESGRFYFIKDTCCDASVIRRRLDICKNTKLKLFNANAQTMLESIKDGCVGYCGVMANFHPALYKKLFENREELLGAFLGLAATVESLTYPCCAKYYLDKFENIKMQYDARSADKSLFSEYQKHCIDQMALLARSF